jgi:hypothetical protein
MDNSSRIFRINNFSVTARQGPVQNVVIEVGPNHTQYHLPKTLLTHYSEYFDKALNGLWKQSSGEPIKLDDVSPTVFNLFVNWLYSQKNPYLFAWNSASEWDMDGVEALKYNECAMLEIMLYAFADRSLVPTLYTGLNRLLTAGKYGAPSLDVITYAFNHLPDTEPVLQFIVDVYCSRDAFSYKFEPEDKVRGWEEKLPCEFLLRVAMRTRVVSEPGLEAPVIESCDYHGHTDEAQRHECKREVEDLERTRHLVLTNTGL